MKLIIQLSNITEQVSLLLVDKLYTLASTNALTNDSDLQGSITASILYDDAIQYLRTKFPNLIISATDYYIRFADANVLNVLLANNIGDGTGITKPVANNTNIGSIFANNTDITTFNELKYFKAPVYPYSIDLRGCSNLLCIDIGSPTEQSNATSNWISDKLMLSGNQSITKFHGPNSETGYLITAELGSNFNYVTGILTLELYSPNIFVNGMQGLSNLSKIIWKCPTGASFGTNVFWNCPITEVVIDNIDDWWSYSFSDIDSGPFQAGNAKLMCNGSEITQVTVPQTVITIKSGAFRGLKRLTSCTFHSNITSIGYYAFYLCTNLVIPDLNLPNLSSIGSNAFYNTKIQSVSNLGSITSIPANCFRDCSDLTAVNIPSTVTSIGFSTFLGDSNLSNFHSSADEGELNLPNLTGSATLGGAVGSKAFSGTKLKKITSLGTCTLLYESFMDATYLESAILPNTLTNISNRSFYSSGLKSLVVPDSVTEIGWRAFCLCDKLLSITFGSGLQTIGSEILLGANALQSITVTAMTPPTFSGSSTNPLGLPNEILNTVNIYVPSSVVSTYQAASGWSDYASRIQAIST